MYAPTDRECNRNSNAKNVECQSNYLPFFSFISNISTHDRDNHNGTITSALFISFVEVFLSFNPFSSVMMCSFQNFCEYKSFHSFPPSLVGKAENYYSDK